MESSIRVMLIRFPIAEPGWDEALEITIKATIEAILKHTSEEGVEDFSLNALRDRVLTTMVPLPHYDEALALVFAYLNVLSTLIYYETPIRHVGKECHEVTLDLITGLHKGPLVMVEELLKKTPDSLKLFRQKDPGLYQMVACNLFNLLVPPAEGLGGWKTPIPLNDLHPLGVLVGHGFYTRGVPRITFFYSKEDGSNILPLRVEATVSTLIDEREDFILTSYEKMHYSFYPTTSFVVCTEKQFEKFYPCSRKNFTQRSDIPRLGIYTVPLSKKDAFIHRLQTRLDSLVNSTSFEARAILSIVKDTWMGIFAIKKTKESFVYENAMKHFDSFASLHLPGRYFLYYRFCPTSAPPQEDANHPPALREFLEGDFGKRLECLCLMVEHKIFKEKEAQKRFEKGAEFRWQGINKDQYNDLYPCLKNVDKDFKKIDLTLVVYK